MQGLVGAVVVGLAAFGLWAYFDARSRLEALGRRVAYLEGRLSAVPAPVEKRRAIRTDPAARCTGVIAQNLLKTVVERRGAEVFACYRTRLEDDPHLQGLIVVELEIGPAGRVSRVRFKGSLRDPMLHSCIIERTGEWQLPPPVNGTCALVQLPFDLRP